MPPIWHQKFLPLHVKKSQILGQKRNLLETVIVSLVLDCRASWKTKHLGQELMVREELSTEGKTSIYGKENRQCIQFYMYTKQYTYPSESVPDPISHCLIAGSSVPNAAKNS